MKKYLLALLLLPSLTALRAQKFPEHPEATGARNKGNAILFHIGFGMHLPGGDLADRFGLGNSVGGGLEWISSKTNLIVGTSGHLQYGNQVKEDPLEIIRTAEGDIIASDRTVASVVTRQRGWYWGGHVGKLFPIIGNRSGLRITLGAGAYRHWIRIQDDSQAVVQLSGDYKKGYDRRSGGVALQQFLGWQHLSANRKANWYIGVEMLQGFTRSLRDWDFSLQQKIEGRRTDLQFGIRAGWTLPFYTSGADEIYY